MSSDGVPQWGQFLITRNSIRHSTAITLHNPYVDFSDSQSTSASRCVQAARAILTAYYRLYETSLDITRLHPLVVVGARPYSLFMSPLYFSSQICWYLAAVVQVQLCKYFIEIGDVSRETTIWGEINVLRYASILPRKNASSRFLGETHPRPPLLLCRCLSLRPILLDGSLRRVN